MARCGAVHHLIIKATKNSPLAQNYGRRFLHVRDVHSSSNIYQVHALPDEVLWNLRWTEFDILLSFNTHANNIFRHCVETCSTQNMPYPRSTSVNKSSTERPNKYGTKYQAGGLLLAAARKTPVTWSRFDAHFKQRTTHGNSDANQRVKLHNLPQDSARYLCKEMITRLPAKVLYPPRASTQSFNLE